MIGARGRKRSRDAREEKQRSVSGHARCEDRIRPSDADPQKSRSLGSWIILERTFLLLLLSIDLTLEKDFWEKDFVVIRFETRLSYGNYSASLLCSIYVT